MGINTASGLYLMGAVTVGGNGFSEHTKYNNIESILGVDIITLN